jgi:hypothetical protein
MLPKTTVAVQGLLNPYGVNLDGNWNISNSYSAYVGVYKTGEALRPYADSGGASAFKDSFGKMRFTSETYLGGWYGIASDGRISFLAGAVTPRLVVHELGHSFEKHIWGKNGSKYSGTNNPIELLNVEGVYDINNHLITGKGNRNNDRSAPFNGYLSDYIPDQYHPRNMIDGDNTYEDWADLFLNWSFNSFSSNIAGDALYNWVSINMKNWVD